jgi:hypothetical protein
MPDPVHDHTNRGCISKAEGFHADDWDLKLIHYENDENVSKKEPGNRNEKVGEKGRRPVVKASPMNGCPDPNGKGKGPCEDGADNEKGQTVQKPFPDFCQHRLVVFPGHGSAGEKISVIVEILNVKRLVEVKGLAEPLHEFRGEARVERVYLARFARRKIHDEKRHDGDEEQSDNLLNDASADERKHKKCLKLKSKSQPRKHETIETRKKQSEKKCLKLMNS